MAKKEIKVQFKLQAPGGTATPAPPIGPALGQHGINPGQFIQRFIVHDIINRTMIGVRNPPS